MDIISDIIELGLEVPREKDLNNWSLEEFTLYMERLGAQLQTAFPDSYQVKRERRAVTIIKTTPSPRYQIGTVLSIARGVVLAKKRSWRNNTGKVKAKELKFTVYGYTYDDKTRHVTGANGVRLTKQPIGAHQTAQNRHQTAYRLILGQVGRYDKYLANRTRVEQQKGQGAEFTPTP